MDHRAKGKIQNFQRNPQEKNLCDLELGNAELGMIPKPQFKTEIDYLGHHQY